MGKASHGQKRDVPAWRKAAERPVSGTHMSRFEIEDIVSQDKRGIVFRAHDSEKGHTVALRRFFPFGQEGGGLSEEEAVAFRIAAKRLDGVRHDSLRSVIAGSVDPIDGMPFIVAEWIDGAPLDTILDGGKLDAAHVTELLRLALEVSLALSEVLGEEVVWVETEPDSIYVGSQESCRGFVFWLSPFKWLGAEFGSRKLAAIVELGERLAGWKGKIIGDQAGNGLGGWLKWMKANPDAGLAEALEALAATTGDGESPPPSPPAFAASASAQPVVKVKPPSALSPLMIAACIGLLLAVGGLAVYHKTAKAPAIPPQYVEQEISPPVVDPAPEPSAPVETANTARLTPPEPAPVANAPKPAPAPIPQLAPDTEVISTDKVMEMAEKLAREKEIQRAAAIAPPVAPPLRDLTPGDGERMKELKANGPASVTGVLLDVRLSAAGNSLYFDFSKPADFTEVMAVAHKRGYTDDFSPGAYSDLIGKKVRFEGTVFREPDGKQFVKISTRKKINVVE